MSFDHRLLDERGQPLELVLFKFDACPFCVRVKQTVEELGLAMSYRDTRAEQGVRDELIERGGKAQVPCLFINGEALYETADIIAFLRSRPLGESVSP